MARDVRCLQVLLRHRVTGQPPPLALTRQLQAQLLISSRGAFQWQQQLMAALADARLAAAAAAAAAAAGDGGGSSSCWDVLAEVVGEYDPLPQKGLHPALLKYLPGAAVMPGCGYSYVFAELVSAAAWAYYLQEDPLDPAAGLALRRRLFEASAAAGTAAVVEGLLGEGSMMPLAVPGVSGIGSSSSSSSSSSSRKREEVHAVRKQNSLCLADPANPQQRKIASGLISVPVAATLR
ncbi:hypothetical protein OEZ86_014435 [Tetradesmus obliquus]|nr:hypothetical protein OEZ86_014435 [Tetradesmus obliquus]